MNGDLYMAVAPHIVGSPADWSTTYEPVSDQHPTRDAAIREGFRRYGSDDFNVAVIRRGVVVALDWMDQPRERHQGELEAVAMQLGFAAPRDRS